MSKIGFIGMGNMGYALMNGCLNCFEKEEIVFHDFSTERSKKVSDETGVSNLESNEDVIENSKFVVLAIKPQVYEEALNGVESVVSDDTIIISLAPGISVDKVKDLTGAVKVIRTMPNTPAMVGAGMTGICYDESKFSSDEIEVIDKIFNSIGKYKKVDEDLMDAVVCASGSSPAYVFMFIDALAESCVKLGLSKEDATNFVAQTVYGSAKLLMETKTDPQILKENVCSPGGTTIEGVMKLEEYGFDKAIDEATKACFDKCKKLK